MLFLICCLSIMAYWISCNTKLNARTRVGELD
nr:MAG TPA: hypothetical protein [Caudoviricetes sp.]